MSDISKISISILYGYMNDFSNEKSNFSSVSRATYNSSYINNSSDDIVLKMKSSLDKYYGRLDNGYSKINEWFSDYVNSAIALGNYIAGSGSYGSITEDRLRNYASYNLKELPHYKAEFRNFQLKGSTSMFNKVLAKGTGAVNDTISYLGLEDEVNFVYDVANVAYDNIVVPYIKPAVSAVLDFYERTNATVSTGVLSVAEGVLEFAEDIVDLGYILCTAVSSIATGVADGVQAISSLITGNEWESMTKKMWNETLDFTSEEHVKNCFNEFYESNVVGQYLKEKSFGFDTVRSVGSGVGYTAGIIVTSAATGGSTVLIAGAAGTSRGINDARRDGATISESLLYGAASGAWESFQWYLGSEIISKLKIGLPRDGLATIGKKALNSLVKVTADSADSAVEGFVQPALKSIYKDSVVDANGNTISLENKSILEKYKELFNENGGWQTVLTQAAIGGLMSGGSEIIDIGKYNRQLKETGANITEPKLKNNDVDLNKTTINSNKISIEGQIDFANRQTAKGGFYTIALDSLDDMSDELWSKIDDPSNVRFKVGDKFYSYADAKWRPEIKTNTIKNIDDQIAMANYYSKKGNFYTIALDSLDDMSDELWSKIDDPSNVRFKVGDKYYSYADAKWRPEIKANTIKNIDDQIAMANYYSKKGNFYTIALDSLDDMSDELWSKIDDPSNVRFKVGDKYYSYDDFFSITKEDVVALLSNADISFYYKKWSKNELGNLLHNLFDSTVSYEKIQNVLDEIHVIDENKWSSFLTERGQNANILGFVDKNSQLYLPSNANSHTAVHEAFHKISELRGLKTYNSEGLIRKVSGIREFYNDGFDTTLANETLTEYLSSKYSDGKIYSSMYGMENVFLWNRIDDAISQLNPGYDVLASSYFNNDTTQIRDIFSKYCTKGTYDDFARYLSTSYKDSKILDEMVSSIEINTYKSSHPLKGILKSIFGGK